MNGRTSKLLRRMATMTGAPPAMVRDWKRIYAGLSHRAKARARCLLQRVAGR